MTMLDDESMYPLWEYPTHGDSSQGAVNQGNISTGTMTLQVPSKHDDPPGPKNPTVGQSRKYTMTTPIRPYLYDESKGAPMRFTTGRSL